MPMDRRQLLLALAALPFSAHAEKKGQLTMKDIENMQKSWKNFLAPGAPEVSPAEPLKLADAEWKKRLAGESYSVLRHEGTERAGTSPLNGEKRAGVFVCAGCG